MFNLLKAVLTATCKHEKKKKKDTTATASSTTEQWLCHSISKGNVFEQPLGEEMWTVFLQTYAIIKTGLV